MKCIFITSLGRTGTMSLASGLAKMIEDCTAVHDPDVLRYAPLSESMKKIRLNGLFKMTLGRVSRAYSMDLLGIGRIRKRVNDPYITRRIQEIRTNTLRTIGTQTYLESNNQLRGVIDLLPQAFPGSRTVFLIRDPRYWVQSWLNKPIPRYSRQDIRNWLPNARLKPHHFPGDPFRHLWNGMDAFERLCWAWSRENAYALGCVRRSASAMVIRFEDLFAGGGARSRSLERLLDFVTRFPGASPTRWEMRPELFEKKMHATKDRSFPDWPFWSQKQVGSLVAYCGDLMEAFGYGEELAWKRMEREVADSEDACSVQALD